LRILALTSPQGRKSCSAESRKAGGQIGQSGTSTVHSNSGRNANYGEATGAQFPSVTEICTTNQERQRNGQECPTWRSRRPCHSRHI
jgi:hypothetical protein